MAQQTFGNLETRSAVRSKLNANANDVESRLAALGSAGGGWPAFRAGSPLATNFNFSGTEIVAVSLASGNVVGTLPVSPSDGQICAVYVEGMDSASSAFANRFTFGRNTKTFNFSGSTPLANKSTAFATSNLTTSLVTTLGADSFTSNNAGDIAYISTYGRAANGCIRIGTSGTYIDLVLSVGANAVLRFWVEPNNNASLKPSVSIGGSALTATQIGGDVASFTWAQYSYQLGASAGTKTVRIQATNSLQHIDDMEVLNINGTVPTSAITSPSIAPGGVCFLQWDQRIGTWMKLF
jgi:hypothetical protein